MKMFNDCNLNRINDVIATSKMGFYIISHQFYIMLPPCFMQPPLCSLVCFVASPPRLLHLPACLPACLHLSVCRRSPCSTELSCCEPPRTPGTALIPSGSREPSLQDWPVGALLAVSIDRKRSSPPMPLLGLSYGGRSLQSTSGDSCSATRCDCISNPGGQ